VRADPRADDNLIRTIGQPLEVGHDRDRAPRPHRAYLTCRPNPRALSSAICVNKADERVGKHVCAIAGALFDTSPAE